MNACLSLVFSILELLSIFGRVDGRCVLYIKARCGQYAGASRAWYENWPVRPMRPVRPVRGLYTPVEVRVLGLGLGLVVVLGLALINSHMSRKSRTASYLALGRIWHDNGLISV